jgi:Domain of unknown function (DUF4191)
MAAKQDKSQKNQDKSIAKEAARLRREASRERRKQIIQAFKIQRREDKWLLPLMIGAFVLCVAATFGIGFVWGLHWMFLPLGIGLGLLAAVVIFGRRVQRTVYSRAEGQPGAAAWALENMRGRWRVTPAVAGTTQMDAVHRVIGRPGVVLVAEGVPHRVKNLLAQEKKRIARVVGETPIYDVHVGNAEGQIPLKRLQAHIMKLPRNITPKQIDTLEGRLSALASRGATIPKGPLPQGAKLRSLQRTVRRR